MRVVVAPDKFKGCLSARDVADAVGDGLRRGVPGLEATLLPVADGGDGTVDAALFADFEPVVVDAVGPTGRPVRAVYAVRDGLAIVELAEVVGLDRLPDGQLDPLGSSTYGLGLVVRAALDRGVDTVVLAVGGSASTDGGAGLLQALGARLVDADGVELPAGGGSLGALSEVDLSGLHPRVAATEFVVASDVDNPLLGRRGAAEVFGPQKGASPAQIRLLEAGLEQWALLLSRATGTDAGGEAGAGAAGGTAFAALSVLGARLESGIDLVLDLVGFPAASSGADLIVTGEGSLDEQSLAGKAPMGVSAAAASVGVPVVAVAGRCLLSAERLAAAGISAAYPLSDLEPDVQRSMANAAPLLVVVGERIAKEWLT